MKGTVFLILCFGCFFCANVFGQNQKTDSLLAALKSTPRDTNYVHILQDLCFQYQLSDQPDKANSSADEALALSTRLSYKRGIIRSYNLLGIGAYQQDNYPGALELYLKALKIAEETGSKSDMANSYQRISGMYFLEKNTGKSLDYAARSLQLYKELADKRNMAYAHLQIAHICEQLKKDDGVEQNFLAAIKLSKSINDLRQLGVLYEQYGNFYIDRQKYDQAVYYHQLSLEASKTLKDDKGVADSYSDIGNIYLAENNYKKALESNLAALDLYLKCDASPETVAESYMIVGQIYMGLEETQKAINYHVSALTITEQMDDDHAFSARVLFSMSEVYTHAKNYSKAAEYLDKVIVIAKHLGDEGQLKACYQKLSALAMKEEDYKKAYAFQKLYAELNDSVYDSNEQEHQRVQQLQEQFEAEKKENEKNLHRAQISQKELELKQAATLRYALLAGLLLILIFAGFIYNRFKLTQKQKETITLQKEMVEIKRKETELQKRMIEDKQKEIIESISYAQRLQEAILPSKEFLRRHIPGHFILYRPKDLVAGDFYWAEQIGHLFFIAAADSTGHGVPGAMVSVVCSNALNRAVKEFRETETGRILDKTRELVLETFEKSESEVKDGMDISLLCIDELNKKVYWSGANNPLWYIQDGEMLEIKADKQPIGQTDHPKPFTTHQVPYVPGSVFYLFTDGYADQFGGSLQKKFKYKPLRDLLYTNSGFDLDTQKQLLQDVFIKWKGELEQVDDVCIIGIKL